MVGGEIRHRGRRQADIDDVAAGLAQALDQARRQVRGRTAGRRGRPRCRPALCPASASRWPGRCSRRRRRSAWRRPRRGCRRRGRCRGSTSMACRLAALRSRRLSQRCSAGARQGFALQALAQGGFVVVGGHRLHAGRRFGVRAPPASASMASNPQHAATTRQDIAPSPSGLARHPAVAATMRRPVLPTGRASASAPSASAGAALLAARYGCPGAARGRRCAGTSRLIEGRRSARYTGRLHMGARAGLDRRGQRPARCRWPSRPRAPPPCFGSAASSKASLLNPNCDVGAYAASRSAGRTCASPAPFQPSLIAATRCGIAGTQRGLHWRHRQPVRKLRGLRRQGFRARSQYCVARLVQRFSQPGILPLAAPRSSPARSQAARTAPPAGAAHAAGPSRRTAPSRFVLSHFALAPFSARRCGRIPLPRALSAKVSTTCKLTRTMGSTTSCAIRSPGCMVKASRPRFQTLISSGPW